MGREVLKKTIMSLMILAGCDTPQVVSTRSPLPKTGSSDQEVTNPLTIAEPIHKFIQNLGVTPGNSTEKEENLNCENGGSVTISLKVINNETVQFFEFLECAKANPADKTSITLTGQAISQSEKSDSNLIRYKALELNFAGDFVDENGLISSYDRVCEINFVVDKESLAGEICKSPFASGSFNKGDYPDAQNDLATFDALLKYFTDPPFSGGVKLSGKWKTSCLELPDGKSERFDLRFGEGSLFYRHAIFKTAATDNCKEDQVLSDQKIDADFTSNASSSSKDLFSTINFKIKSSLHVEYGPTTTLNESTTCGFTDWAPGIPKSTHDLTEGTECPWKTDPAAIYKNIYAISGRNLKFGIKSVFPLNGVAPEDLPKKVDELLYEQSQ